MLKAFTDQVIGNLMPSEAIKVFPRYEDRDQWEKIEASLRKELIQGAEAYWDYQWPQLRASTYRQYQMEGMHQSDYSKTFMARRVALGSLIIGECLEGQGRFFDDIVNGIYAICEESTWLVPQHFRNYNPKVTVDALIPSDQTDHIDLFAAETGALLTWCHYLLGQKLDSISPNICPRILGELDRRIIKPYLKHDQFFWMGYTQEIKFINNWNPWINANCMMVFLLTCRDEEDRKKGVAKILESAQFYIDLLGDEGGCNEGPAYWMVGPGKLFELMEMVTIASQGKVNLYTSKKFELMGTYIHKMYVGNDTYVNFSDAKAKDPKSKDGAMIYRYGLAAGNESLKEFGRYVYQSGDIISPSGNTYHMYRHLNSLFCYEELMSQSAVESLLVSAYISDIEIAVARAKADSKEGFFFAAKGGSNYESHNHNDVGSLVLYHNGEPVLVDPGALEYTKNYFNEHRYEHWVTQSAYHNLPTVNGFMQKDGPAYHGNNAVFTDQEGWTGFTLDLAGAYVVDSKIMSWQRSVDLYREDDSSHVVVGDLFNLHAIQDETYISLMVHREVMAVEDQTIRLCAMGASPEILMKVEGCIRDIQVEAIDLSGTRKLTQEWGGHLYRIKLCLDPRENDNRSTVTISSTKDRQTGEKPQHSLKAAGVELY